jgi:hypothetical protein
MRTRTLIRFAVAASLAGFSAASLAATAEDAKSAIEKAEAADRQAAALRNQWTTTEDALKKAKAAAGAGKFDDAIKLAQEAEALANGSIAQAKEQEKVWRDAVIR